MSGPLLWARVATLLMRFSNGMDAEATDTHTYVDDPLSVVVGSGHSAKMKFMKMAVLWRLLGSDFLLVKVALGERCRG